MTKKAGDKRVGSILLESPEAVAGLLKSAAHPARIHILALLQQDEHGLSDMIRHTGLSKNALVNHLALLMSMKLVERVSRGKYRLTEDGGELVDAATVVYENSLRREEERGLQMRRLYTKGMFEGEKMNKKVISKKVEYMPGWLSYTGAVAGSLRALGVDCDVVDVGGRSGYAFIINVSKGKTCISGPTALPDETWEIIHHATEDLGWRMEHWFDNHPYPSKEGSPTQEELERVRKLFEMVTHEIDENDKPVVLWGLAQPEYGIVKGYQGDSYIVSTFRSLIEPGKPEAPIPHHELRAPGCLDAYFFKERTKPSLAADKQALERAIKFAAANLPVGKNYVAGPTGLDEWADVLESLPEKEQDYMGNSYVGACYAEGREMSAAFLKRLAKKHRGKQSKHLTAAVGSYGKGAELMRQFTKLFPFKPEGEMKLETRNKGASILRNVKSSEEEAIEHMKMALKEWERA